MASTPGRLTANTTSTGSAMATTLNQYCSACTRVMDRIPPATTLSVTTSATTTTPTQRGRPVTSRSTRPAPCSCGTR